MVALQLYLLFLIVKFDQSKFRCCMFAVSYLRQLIRRDVEMSARALVECMQLQCKLYDEGLEVMSDYSTVFSQERNLSTHAADPSNHNSLVSWQICTLIFEEVKLIIWCCRYMRVGLELCIIE
jgi:hypothetical protein